MTAKEIDRVDIEIEDHTETEEQAKRERST